MNKIKLLSIDSIFHKRATVRLSALDSDNGINLRHEWNGFSYICTKCCRSVIQSTIDACTYCNTKKTKFWSIECDLVGRSGYSVWRRINYLLNFLSAVGIQPTATSSIPFDDIRCFANKLCVILNLAKKNPTSYFVTDEWCKKNDNFKNDVFFYNDLDEKIIFKRISFMNFDYVLNDPNKTIYVCGSNNCVKEKIYWSPHRICQYHSQGQSQKLFDEYVLKRCIDNHIGCKRLKDNIGAGYWYLLAHSR